MAKSTKKHLLHLIDLVRDEMQYIALKDEEAHEYQQTIKEIFRTLSYMQLIIESSVVVGVGDDIDY